MTGIDPIAAIQVGFWFLAGLISLYFSIGNTRIWTSISIGFFLIFVSRGYLVAPWVADPRLAAFHYIVGTIAIMVVSYGFQEYYDFSRTLEITGEKWVVFATAAGIIFASFIFLLINPPPSPAVLRHIHIIENANWVFLALINLVLIWKIYQRMRDAQVAPGLIAFGAVFVLIFLWRGAELYLQVYAWDGGWLEVLRGYGVDAQQAQLARIGFSRWVSEISGMLASVSVAGTFIYLLRLLR